MWERDKQELMVNPKNLTIPPIFPDDSIVRHSYAVNYSNMIEMDRQIGELIESDDETYRSINWSDMPPKTDLNVRMSGLVWPEASQRIANSAYLTRERIGRGQVILFAGEPNFRGAALGTNRLWLNAVVYGSGLGTSARIVP